MMTTINALPRSLPWLPLVAACLHVTEEFVLPGGFMRWYRGYRGADVESITPRFLVTMNALMLGSCLWLAVSMQGMVGVAYWMFMAGILASNGVWHVYASLRTRA